MKVYEALAEGFAGEGTTAIFGLMGGGNAHFMVAFQKFPDVHVYDVRHEGPGLAMADGWARVTGNPGVCTVTCGPGLTQLATSLVVARRAGTPLVVFAADLPEGAADHQLFDQSRFAEACEAGFVRVTAPDVAFDAVRKAFYIARTESRPVILDGPMDVLEMEFEKFADYVPSMALLPQEQRIAPDPGRIAAAAQILRESKKPVIIAGRGAIAAGAEDAVQRLAQQSGALVSTSIMAKGFLAGDEFNAGVAGLYASKEATEIFAEADCVVGVGASLNYFTLEAGYLFSNARFIQIDRRPQIVMGNKQVAECYVQADALAGVEALAGEIAKQGHRSTGLRTPEISAALHAREETAFVSEDGFVDPRQAAMVLDEAIPPEIGLVSGNGHFTAFLMEMPRPRDPYIVTMAFGCVGQALGTGIGAAIATGKPTVCIDGDGSITMSLVEFDTMARYALPLLVIVMNDQALGAEYHRLSAHAGHDKNKDLAQMTTPDLGNVARSFGLRGRLVRHIDELRPAIAEWTAEPGPMVIDLRVSKNVLSSAFRRLFHGENA